MGRKTQKINIFKEISGQDKNSEFVRKFFEFIREKILIFSRILGTLQDKSSGYLWEWSRVPAEKIWWIF